ncbi:MAG: hypothetical protein ACXAC7_03580 [Candidatus Hodarchaeales archaeon]|jgi:hypothetical protein
MLKKRNFFVILFIVIVLFTQGFTRIFQSSSMLELNQENNSHPIPFDGFYLQYNLKAKINQTPIPVVNFTVYYQNYPQILPNSSDYDSLVQITIKSSTLLFLGITQENATFFENSTTRKFYLNSTEGSIIAWLLNLIYDSSNSSKNWTPFWIYNNQIELQNSFTYPIYSYEMNFTSQVSLSPQEYSLFNNTHKVLVFDTIQEENRSGSILQHEISLVYDNHSGFLIKGLLITNLIESNSYRAYLMDFELVKTNGFSVFPADTNTNEFILPPLSYILLFIVIISPLGVIIVKFIRRRDINGGFED